MRVHIHVTRFIYRYISSPARKRERQRSITTHPPRQRCCRYMQPTTRRTHTPSSITELHCLVTSLRVLLLDLRCLIYNADTPFLNGGMRPRRSLRPSSARKKGELPSLAPLHSLRGLRDELWVFFALALAPDSSSPPVVCM